MKFKAGDIVKPLRSAVAERFHGVDISINKVMTTRMRIEGIVNEYQYPFSRYKVLIIKSPGNPWARGEGEIMKINVNRFDATHELDIEEEEIL